MKKIIFKKLTLVAKSPDESSPPVVASPAIQQTSVVELPVMQQLPCMQLNTQSPSVEKSPKQHLSTFAGDDDYAPHINEEVDLHLPSDDLNEDEMAPSCAAWQLCSGLVLASLKKALSLVPQLSPELVIASGCR